MSVLDGFHPAVRAWFEDAFGEPSPPQALGWPPIREGRHTIILAPTGSGKTLAAFLECLNQLILAGEPDQPDGVRILYVSPLKALNNDIQRNLARPLAGIEEAAARLGCPLPRLRTAVRTGDTPQAERRAMLRRPPHVLITTPESLYLLLTGEKGAQMLRTVRYVIVDEIHAVAGTKRGVHLALSLERLVEEAGEPVRIGLSATQRPLDEIANFLGGLREGKPRPVTIVDAGMRKEMDLQVVCPASFRNPDGSVWPAVHRQLIEWIRAHRSTIVFVNGRGLAERLAARLNDLAWELGLAPDGVEWVQTHHGSLSRPHRESVESRLKAGKLAGIVATSSLELGIDIGFVDLVVQVESPKSVSRGLQRVGRSGHLLRAASKGRVVPQHDDDLLEAAVIARRMRQGEIEATRIPQNCLDVLAQQVVAMVARREWSVDALLAVVHRAYPYYQLDRQALVAVLRMLTGRYAVPQAEPGPAPVRPRLFFDEARGEVRPHPGSRLVATASGGTIPDRGYYAVHVVDQAQAAGPPAGPGSSAAASGAAPAGGVPPGRRPNGAPRRRFQLGELDEEFVFESRVGDAFRLGNGVWRIESIERDRVLVSPAPGEIARHPFWKGDGLGRPFELGAAIAAFLGALDTELDRTPTDEEKSRLSARLREECALDEQAAANLLEYVERQRAAVGVLPSDRRLVLEGFHDPLGDRYAVLHSAFGGRVNAAWALALQAICHTALGAEAKVLHSDSGIAIKLPEPALPAASAEESWVDAEFRHPALDPLQVVEQALRRITPENVQAIVTSELARSPLFVRCFRHAAMRALLLPRPAGRRLPLWLQRLKAADLLEVARRDPEHPLVLEALREGLEENLDIEGLCIVLGRLQSGGIAIAALARSTPSPFAMGFWQAFTAAFMYGTDEPRMDRLLPAPPTEADRLAALAGSAEPAVLFDAAVVRSVEAELQRTAPGWLARSADELDDLLREVGELSEAEVAVRVAADEAAARAWLADLAGRERVRPVQFLPGGPPYWLHSELSAGVEERVAHFGRRRTLFTTAQVCERYGLAPSTAEAFLVRIEADGALVRGPFLALGEAWCHPQTLATIRRRTLQGWRDSVAPQDRAGLARYLAAWQALRADAGVNGRIGTAAGGPSDLLEAVRTLQGLTLPIAVWERDILRVRVPGYQPAWLDELIARGEALWVGGGEPDARMGHTPGGGASVAFFCRSDLPGEDGEPEDRYDEVALPDPEVAVLSALARRGAMFLPEIVAATARSRAQALHALWRLVWQGLVTNDSFDPIRKALAGFRPPQATRGAGETAPVVGGDGVTHLAVAGRRRALRWAERHVRTRVEAELGFGAGRFSVVPGVARRLSGHWLGLDVGMSEAGASWWIDTLLRRYGVVCRDLFQWEGLAAFWPRARAELERAEWAGGVRRGYFVQEWSGPQFALTEAAELLAGPPTPSNRATPPVGGGRRPGTLLVSALDPANAATLAAATPPEWHPARLARDLANYAVLVEGELVLLVEGYGRRLHPLCAPGDPRLPAALAAFTRLLRLPPAHRPRRRLEVEQWAGRPVGETEGAALLTALGFQPGGKGYVCWPTDLERATAPRTV